MEEEAREILRVALTEDTPPVNLAYAIRARFASLCGVELEVPHREPMQDPPYFN